MSSTEECSQPRDGCGDPFAGQLVAQIRREGGLWRRPGGTLHLPEVFGFCRGVRRAISMAADAVTRRRGQGGKTVLLGEIIHNPWVNDFFRNEGVELLERCDPADLDERIGPGDCAVIPAFGVSAETVEALDRIGCEVIDTTCGDVRRLWIWAEQAASEGYGLLIFGRPRHDETVVTKSRLARKKGSYLIVKDLDQTRRLAELVCNRADDIDPRAVFGEDASNATTLEPLLRLAQVSQTTMLYDETMAVRDIIREAFIERFGPQQADQRLAFHPTVCRATQDRQTAAEALCREGCDLAVIVGGYRSSNTRHLYELAAGLVPAYFIESADAIHSASEILTSDADGGPATVARGWLPNRRPIHICVLAGASCPEIVVEAVLLRLSELLR